MKLGRDDVQPHAQTEAGKRAEIIKWERTVSGDSRGDRNLLKQRPEGSKIDELGQ